MPSGQSVGDWGTAMWTAFTGAMAMILGAIPLILAAAIIFGIGWFLGGALGKLTATLLRRVGFEGFSQRIGFSGLLQKSGVERMDASAVIGQAVNWVIRLVFLQMAADALGLTQVTVLLNQMIAFIPNILVATVILMVAGFLGRLLQGVVRGAAGTAGAGNSGLLGEVAYWSIMAFGIIAALNQLSIAPVVVNTLFIGLVATLVLALGLSFGLGGREVAAEMTRAWADRARGMAPQVRQQMSASPYRDPLTQPHPSEHEETPQVVTAHSATPIDQP